MTRLYGMAAAVLLLTACVVETDEGDNDGAARSSPTRSATPVPGAQPQPGNVRLEVSLTQRKVSVYRGDRQIGSYAAAVGSDEWPTPTGEWTISQVIFNPRWVPPRNEAWAEDEKTAEPGAADNPLGVVQLVYEAPNSIHGTNEPESLGKAVSHGSIRVSNNVGVGLARLVMRAGGAAHDDAWIKNALRNRTERAEVSIPNPVPIRVVN